MSEGSHKITRLKPFQWCDKWILHMKVRAANIFAYSKVLASGTTVFFISVATPFILTENWKQILNPAFKGYMQQKCARQFHISTLN